MWTPSSPALTVRGVTFALWALAAASTVYWGLRLAAGQRALELPPAAAPQVAAVDPVALARLLGSEPAALSAPMAAPSLASRFQLVGVAAGVASGGGAAVIAVDGKPARPYRVGASIEEGVVLQSVRGRQAVLAAANGQPLLTLELPPPPVATNQPPGAANQPPAAMSQPPAAINPPPAAMNQPPAATNQPPAAPILSPRAAAQSPSAAPR